MDAKKIILVEKGMNHTAIIDRVREIIGDAPIEIVDVPNMERSNFSFEAKPNLVVPPIVINDWFKPPITRRQRREQIRKQKNY